MGIDLSEPSCATNQELMDVLLKENDALKKILGNLYQTRSGNDNGSSHIRWERVSPNTMPPLNTDVLLYFPHHIEHTQYSVGIWTGRKWLADGHEPWDEPTFWAEITKPQED